MMQDGWYTVENEVGGDHTRVRIEDDLLRWQTVGRKTLMGEAGHIWAIQDNPVEGKVLWSFPGWQLV